MAGRYQEILNSDANCYSGSNLGNHGGRDSENIAWMGFSQSINIHIPPLAGLILKVDADAH